MIFVAAIESGIPAKSTTMPCASVSTLKIGKFQHGRERRPESLSRDVFSAEGMLQIGDPAPDFTLYDADKKERKLSEFLFRGKKTILAFFPGAFTNVCTQELCAFRDMFSDLEKMNAQLVAISVDAPWPQKAYAEKYGFKFPLLCDFNREVTRRYDLLWKNLGDVIGYDVSNRAIFILDSGGKVLYSWVAPHTSVNVDLDAIKRNL
jgi:glutaredoxin-dependent peroxiredoxin